MPIQHRSYPYNPLTAESVAPQIVIGPDEHDIEIPRVDAALGESLAVDDANPWFSTDGTCLFSKDGSALIRCLTKVEEYEIPRICTRIEDEAFAYNTLIKAVTLHDEITHIGKRAFISTTIEGIRIPGSVAIIDDEAFAQSKALKFVDIEEGVRLIGNRAFFDCPTLAKARIPGSVRNLGKQAFSQCRLKAGGPDPDLTIEAGNEDYFIDESGVLYHRTDNGLELECAIDHVTGEYDVLPGTVRICGRAFAFNRNLERIVLPSGLVRIGSRAFLECDRLSSVNIPEGVKQIGAEAFYHTALAKISLPSTLEELGPASLVVNITIASQSRQTGVGGRGASDFYNSALSGKLHEVSMPRFNVSVAPGNARFVLAGGFLCERLVDNSLRAVQFVSGDATASIPDNVTSIAEYAMFGVENVNTLRLHTGISSIGHSALSLSYPLELIEVDCHDGNVVKLYPAPNSSGTIAARKAFRAGWLDLDRLVDDCDSSLSFMMPGHERTRRMLARLVNGQRLTERYEREFQTTVSVCIDELVRQFARTDDRRGIYDLLNLGFIDGDSIVHAIDVANSAGGVSSARVLLEEKHARFGDTELDFSL